MHPNLSLHECRFVPWAKMAWASFVSRTLHVLPTLRGASARMVFKHRSILGPSENQHGKSPEYHEYTRRKKMPKPWKPCSRVGGICTNRLVSKRCARMSKQIIKVIFKLIPTSSENQLKIHTKNDAENIEKYHQQYDTLSDLGSHWEASCLLDSRCGTFLLRDRCSEARRDTF